MQNKTLLPCHAHTPAGTAKVKIDLSAALYRALLLKGLYIGPHAVDLDFAVPAGVHTRQTRPITHGKRVIFCLSVD